MKNPINYLADALRRNFQASLRFDSRTTAASNLSIERFRLGQLALDGVNLSEVIENTR